MKKIVILSASLLLSVTFVFAQKNNSSNYTNAIGLKFYPTGITFKHFFNEKNSGELIGYFYNYGTRITGLYEINFDISAVDGLGWYVGPGAHIGFFDTKHGGGTSLGVDGVIGLDYKFSEIPLNLSLDFQPSFELSTYYGDNRFSGWGGLGIRYTF
jgi:hypothetical protein